MKRKKKQLKIFVALVYKKQILKSKFVKNKNFKTWLSYLILRITHKFEKTQDDPVKTDQNWKIFRLTKAVFVSTLKITSSFKIKK